MRMIKDVLPLRFDGGFSHDRIAAPLSISEGVVTKYIGLACAAGLDWASACGLFSRRNYKPRIIEHTFAL